MPHATTTPTSPRSKTVLPAVSVERVTDLLSRATCVVLDFDGPVARLFAGGHEGKESVAGRIAEELLDIAASHRLEVDEMRGCTDPHAIFSCYAGRAAHYGESEAWGSAAAEMQGVLTAWEIKSAEHAEPTPGAAEFMKAWAGAGRRLAVASNNHPDAIKRYLERESLSKYFVPSSVIGRNERDAALMKPNPWALNEVMRDSAGGVAAHLMVGDSATDWQTANAVGMPFIGFHRKPEKRVVLSRGGAVPVLDSMQVLADAARGLQAQVR